MFTQLHLQDLVHHSQANWSFQIISWNVVLFFLISQCIVRLDYCMFVIADLNLILSSIMSLIAAVYCFVMFYNFLIAMALLIKDQAIHIWRTASHFALSGLYLFAHIPLSFTGWYCQCYKAFEWVAYRSACY